LRLLLAMGEKEQNGGRMGVSDDLEKKRGAVGVAPLGVIDVNDQRLALRQNGQQIA
jgi:hypothetical protein